ncbi:MAG: hypothetical protein DMD80_06095 [Candidatus Rokuibacteriota bacterium]|nr:MAG: hypothetical protein DMD80_06095 [Candidatus Rokubacteria bacterium]
MPPPTPTTPPMAAPLPAPLPPPAIAPPAAPTAAPTTAPIAPSLTTSIVLSFEPVSLAAYLLHASIALWLGAAGALATRAGVACCTFCCVFCSCAARSPPVQFATTRPVTRAVAITTAMPIVVTFHGFIRLSLPGPVGYLRLPLRPYASTLPCGDAPSLGRAALPARAPLLRAASLPVVTTDALGGRDDWL